MKILYILATLMFLGIFLIVVCSLKVLNDMSGSSKDLTIRSRYSRPLRQPPQQTRKPEVRPATQPYIIGTYLGITFFLVGGVGSMVAVFQVMKRGT